jgi:two-component system response regulator BaeR
LRVIRTPNEPTTVQKMALCDATAVKRSILVVDDEPHIACLLRDYLLANGFAPEIIADGNAAVARVKAAAPALLLLDLQLPGLDGVGVCDAVRRFSGMPILMVSAHDSERDRLRCFNSGADDYVCKPFSLAEMLARVRALLRRAGGATEPTRIEVDDAGGCVRWHGTDLPLTPIEFRLLRLLFSRPGRIFSRAELMQKLHSDFRDASDRAIDSHIKNLRRKILAVEAGGGAIATVYGVGYRFELAP